MLSAGGAGTLKLNTNNEKNKDENINILSEVEELWIS